jgi:hypothetical protein
MSLACVSFFVLLFFSLPVMAMCEGDFDCDGDVDGTDLAIFAADFGRTDCPACIPAPVPATGQQTSDAVGDDGDLQMGVIWPVPRFTDNEDGTVKDGLTGLIWLKNANCPNGAKFWSDALTFANSLYDGWTGDGSGGDCGLSDGSSAGDWRLPNVRELHSLIEFGSFNPALPSGHPFISVQSSDYWSSTTRAASSDWAWFVTMHDGIVNNYSKDHNNYYVWPVRGDKFLNIPE